MKKFLITLVSIALLNIPSYAGSQTPTDPTVHYEFTNTVVPDFPQPSWGCLDLTGGETLYYGNYWPVSDRFGVPDEAIQFRIHNWPHHHWAEAAGDSTEWELSNSGTIALWIYCDTPGAHVQSTQLIFDKKKLKVGGTTNNPEHKQLYLDTSSYRLNFYLHNVMGGSPLTSIMSIPMYEWTHIAGVYDGSSAYIYINGFLDNSKEANGDVGDHSGTVEYPIAHNTMFGKPYWPDISQFYGRLDDFRFYKEALSPEEIYYLAWAEWPPPCLVSDPCSDIDYAIEGSCIPIGDDYFSCECVEEYEW